MKTIKNILVIRFRRVGDAVISSVLCTSLKKTFPDASIHYVLNESIAPLFENHPDIDRLITFSNKDMSKLSVYTRKVKQIMKEGNYDLIVDTRSTIKTLWFSLFSMNTPYRIGKKKTYNPLIHNHRVDIEGVVDEVTKTLLLLKPLENDYQVQYDRRFRVYVTEEEKESFARYMKKKGIDLAKPIIVCAVTARLIHKIWDKERMKAILLQLVDTYDLQLIFNYGGKEEKDFASQLHRELDNHPSIFADIEANNLRELPAMMANSHFFFGNEGGPRHISQALDIPSYAIYPPQAAKAEWLPNACDRFQGIEPRDVSDKTDDNKMPYKEKFDFITPEVVWDGLSRMLDSLGWVRKEKC